MVLARQDGATWALTATNNSPVPRTVTVTVPPGVTLLQDGLTNTPVRVNDSRLQLVVPPLYGRVLTTTLP